MPAGSTGPAHAAPRRRGRGRRAVLVVLPLVVCLTGLAVALAVRSPAGTDGTGGAGAPARLPGASSAAAEPASSSAQEAARWLSDQSQSGRSGAVAVDPSLYADVAGSSALASRLVPAPLEGTPTGSTASSSTSTPGSVPRWLVAGPELRAGAVPGSWAAEALAASRTVAVFGEGDDRVEVREMTGAGDAPSGRPPAASSPGASSAASQAPPGATSGTPRAAATAASPESLAELLANPRLDFSQQARRALVDRPVDLRLASLLVQLAAQQPLSVADLPGDDAAGGAAEPVRTAVLDGVDGQPVGADPAAVQALQRQLSAQDTAYRASATQEAAQEQDGTTTLRLVLPPAG